MSEFTVDLVVPPQGVYFPGMLVTGAVVCTTQESKDYKQIVIQLVGRANVHWSESSGSGNNRRTHHYRSNEEYVSCVAVLWDKASNAQGGKFPVGSYRFNFNLQLPGHNIPASYTGTVGSITYTLEARIAKSFLKQDKKAITQLNVANVIGINHPELIRPMSKEVRKTLCCLCCASGPIVMTARIPHTGYCIGYDTIPIEVSVENGSSRVIQNVQVALVKRVLYTAQGRHRYDNVTIFTVNTRSVAAHETAVIQSEPLVLPTNIPPSLNNCGILSVSYYVIVKGVVSWSIYPTIEFPVVIGNVPLEGQSGPPQGASFANPDPAFINTQPPATGYPPPPATGYPPPPATGYPPPPATYPDPYPTNAWSDPPPYAPPSNQMPLGFVDPIKKI